MTGASELRLAAEARIGRVLANKWRLDELIGLGGSAAVYAATHRNGSRVAIKVLHRHLFSSEASVRRFVREAYTANRIAHSGAVRIFDDNVDAENAFLVMELLEGVNVADHAANRGGTLPIDDVLGLGDQLLDVLKAAHALGIVHRDIKPGNLFLGDDGRLRVLDFGVARHRPDALDAVTTHDGALVGTPAFMSPEQARGRSELVDARSDIWSVGATLFTLLSGRTVHEASTATEQFGIAMTASARSLGAVAPDLSQELIDVVDRCLRYDPAERYPDAGSAREALRALRGKDTARSEGSPVSAPGRASTQSSLIASTTVVDEAPQRGNARQRLRPVLLVMVLGIGVGALFLVTLGRQQGEASARAPRHETMADRAAMAPAPPAPAMSAPVAMQAVASSKEALSRAASPQDSPPAPKSERHQQPPASEQRRKRVTPAASVSARSPVAAEAPAAPEAPQAPQDPLDRRH